MSIGKIKRDKFLKIVWEDSFAFESYGVKIAVKSNCRETLDRLKQRLPLLLPSGIKEIESETAEHHFSIVWGKTPRQKNLAYRDDEEILRQKASENKLDSLESKIRLTVAEFASDFVFLHAGAVAYQDKAIIIPAKSFSGKTTLVAELAGRGLGYYSDEYAVIDKDGMLHPFTKQLSMRGIINSYEQVDMDVEEFGGSKAEKPINIGLILVSTYKKGSRFMPKLLSSGEGIIESIANSVSIRQNPEFVLRVLGKVMNQAKVVKTNRTEAKQFADKFLPYLDEISF